MYNEEYFFKNRKFSIFEAACKKIENYDQRTLSSDEAVVLNITHWHPQIN